MVNQAYQRLVAYELQFDTRLILSHFIIVHTSEFRTPLLWSTRNISAHMCVGNEFILPTKFFRNTKNL